MKSTLSLAVAVSMLHLAPAALAAPGGMSSLEQVIDQQKRRIAELEQENAALRAKLPASADVATNPPPAPAMTPARPVEPAASSGKVYKVVSGDNLSIIAKKCSVTVDELIKANSIKDPKKLQIGQILKLPSHAKDASAQPSSFNPSTPGKTNAGRTPQQPEIPRAAIIDGKPTAPTSSGKPKLKLVIIQEQSTYSAIAQKYGTTIERLNEINRYSFGASSIITGGSELWIPEP